MSLNKSIESGKDWRKTWQGKNKSKAFDQSCRNHGSCGYCRERRLYRFRKRERSADEQIEEAAVP